MTDTRNK